MNLRRIEALDYKLISKLMKTIFNRSWFTVVPKVFSLPSGLSQSNHELIEEYLTWKKSYSKSAYRSYKVWVIRFQTFVNKPPERMNHADYGAFAESLKGRYAPRAISFALSVIHNYLRFYAEQGRLHFPLYLARVPRGYVRSHEAVAEDEYKMMVAALRAKQPQSLRDLLIVMLLHDTGMRIGELVSLEIEDMEEDCSAAIRTEKTVRERRVFWNHDTDEVLQRYIVERVNEGPSEVDALFVGENSRTGKPITARSVERMFQDVLKSAGITRRLCPHSFRHSFIHRLAKLSVPDAIIAQLVGHTTPFTIANYTKLSRPEFKHYALKQLGFMEGKIAMAV